MILIKKRIPFVLGAVGIIGFYLCFFSLADTRFNLQDHYDKTEYMIAMRDGVKLFTQVYIPKDTGQQYPVLLFRTPYSIGDYFHHVYLYYTTWNSIF